MSDLFEEPEGATPLTPEEMRDLIPAHITFRHELNEAEQENIVRAQDWAMARKRELLTEVFILELHRRMLRDVWKWAGKYRLSERNIGIPYYRIPSALRELLEEVRGWLEYRSYSPDEIAVRLHHRLVQIHLFANGNGRHSRLMADLLIMQLERERFSWGRGNLRDANEMRRLYIEALQAADRHAVARLVEFARS